MAKSRARKLADLIVGAGIDIDGNLTFDGGSTSADLTFADGDKANFGDASDLQIYHTGSSSVIRENGPGTFYIQGTDIVMTDSAGAERYADFTFDGASRLYHDNSVKFATTSTGIDVTGTVTADGLTVDGDVLLNGDRDLHLVATNPNTGTSFQYGEITLGDSTVGQYANHAKIIANGGYANQSNLEFYTSNNNNSPLRMKIHEVGDISFYEDTGTDAKLFWDASEERLGIGTTSPAGLLEISADSDDGTAAPSFLITNASTTLNDGAVVGTIEFRNSDSSGTGPHVAKIQGIANASDERTTELAFSTGSVATTTERMRIDSSGNLIMTAGGTIRAGGVNDLILDAGESGTPDIYLQSGGSTKIKIEGSNGNVGIGTTFPSNTLHINAGNIVNPNTTGSEITSATLALGTNIHLEERQVNGAYSDRTDLAIVTNTGFGIGESEKIRIQASGKVGIGTSSPGYPLEISGEGTVSLAYQRTGTGVTAKKWGFHSDNSHTYWQNITDSLLAVTVSNAGNVGLGTSSLVSTATLTLGGGSRIAPVSGNGLLFAAGGSDRMFLNTSGNLSIGNTNGNSTLDLTKTSDTGERAIRIENSSARLYVGVEGSSGNRFSGSSANNGFIGTTTDDGLEFGTANVVRAVITNTGNVGIGVTDPDVKLEVSGSARFAQEDHAWTFDDTINNRLGFIKQSGSYSMLASASNTPIIFATSNNSDLQSSVSGQTLYERMRIDHLGNVGIGCTPSAHAFSKAIEIGDGAVWTVGGNQNSTFASNAYLASNGSFKYIAANKASKINLYNGGFTVATTNTSGSADDDITFTDKLTVLANGNVGIGTTNPTSALVIQGEGSGGSKKNTIAFGTSGWGSPTAPNAALDGGVKLALFEGGTQKVQIGMDANARLWLMSAGSGAQGVDIYTGASNTAAPTLRFRVDQGGTTNIYGNLAVSSTTSTDVAVVHASGVDTSASMGGQSPKLTVAGYTSLDGLRISGGDTGNTIYKTGGALGITVGDTNLITLTNSNSTARLSAGNWEVLSGGQLRAYRGGNSAYGALYMDTGENLFIYNSWGAKSIVLDRDGKVGIGNTDPQDQLHVLAPINSGIRLQTPTANNSFGDENRIDFHMSNEVSQGTGNPAARIASYLQRNNNGYGIKFGVRYDGSTFNADAMTLTAEGDLGIGTASPEQKLHVRNSVSGNTSQILVQNNTTGDAAIKFNRSGQTFFIGIDSSDNSFRISDNGTGVGYADDRIVINSSGNVGIGTTNPETKLDVSRGADTSGYNTTGDQRSEAGITVRNTSEGTNVFSGINLYTGAGTGADWSINNVRAGNYLGDLTFKTRTGGSTWAEYARITHNGTLGLGITTPITPSHKTSTVTAAQSTSNGWSISTSGTYSSRGAIEVAGITNRHIGKFGLSGNFSANTWYPIVKRSDLVSMAGNTGTDLNGGFGVYFRIYAYTSSIGGGEYLANRVTETVWITDYGSNSNSTHEMRVGAGFGHAPNTGHDADDPSLCPIRMRIAHHYGSDSTWGNQQTFELNLDYALTGADPAAAGKQLIVYAYMI